MSHMKDVHAIVDLVRSFLRALPIELDHRVKNNSLLIAPKAKRA